MHKKKLFLNTYRHFKYFIFKLLYGKISTIIIAKKNKKIVIKKISFNNLISYRLYSIPNGRVYSNTTMDTAFILKKSLINEPSFQYRYHRNLKIVNGPAYENFVIKNGTPNIMKKIDGKTLIIHRLAGKNDLVNILGNGELKAKLNITVHKFTATAKAAIEAAGGEAVAL